MELVLARSAASAASTAPVAAASVAQPTDNSGALPARESAAAAPSLRTAMPTEVDEGGDSGAAWERLVAGALHQPSGSAASSGPPGLGNGFGNGFGGAFSGGGVGNGSLGGLGVTSTGEDGGDGSFGNAFSQQQEAFGRWVAATNNQEGGAGGEVDSGLRSQVAGLSLGASSNTQAPPPGFGGLFGNNSVGLGGSSDAPKPPSLPAPPSQDGFGFENSSSNGLFGNSNGAISSSPPAASSAPDGLPPHLQNLFGPSLPGVRGPGGFPHPSASSNNGGNMGLPPHLLMNEVPPEGLPVDEQDAWRQQRAAQLQFLERRAAHDQMMAARQQQFYQMQMMQFQQQQQQQPRVPPPGVVLPPQPPAASDPWASSSVPSAAGATTATTADTTVKSEQPSLNWRPFADTEVRRPRPRMRGAPASAAATAALLPGVPPAAAGGGATAAAEVGKGALAPVVPDEVKATKVVAAAQAPPMSHRGFGGSGLSFQPLQQQFGVPSASSSLTVAAAARLSAGSPGLQAAAGRVALSKSMFEAHNNKMKMETSAEVATKAAEGTEITNNLVDSGLSSAVKAYTNADGSMATATHTIPSATKHSPVAVPNVLAAAAAELSASLSALGGSFSGIGGDYKDTRMISAEESGEGALLTPWAAGSFATDDTSSSNLSDLSAVMSFFFLEHVNVFFSALALFFVRILS